MTSVTVLLSSFNGEKFIRQQIDSILNQDTENLKLFVRDDGSIDKTLEILGDYQSKGLLSYYQNSIPNYKDINDKIGKSYFDLCKNAPVSEYYAFADQDDFWKSNKLSTAISQLELYSDKDIPLLYCSYAEPVDENLESFNYKPPKVRPKFLLGGRLLMNSVASGCTFVFNRAALNVFLQYQSQYIGIHDWLFSKIIAFTGKIIYDKQSYIKYRQHGNNIIGVKEDNMSKKSKRHFEEHNVNLRSNVAKEVLLNYCEILDEKSLYHLDILTNYRLSFIKKIKLLFSRKITGNRILSKLGIKLLIILNKL